MSTIIQSETAIQRQKQTKRCDCNQTKQKVLPILAFITNLFYIAAAELHLQTATACKTYQNLFNSSNPRYDFQGLVHQIYLVLVVIAVVQLILLILNALLLLFNGWAKSLWWYISAMVTGIIGVLLSAGAPIIVMVQINKWNTINKSSNSIFKLYKSVFVGDLSKFELLFKYEILFGWLLFFLGSVYILGFWIRTSLIKYRQIQKQNKQSELQSESKFNEQKQSKDIFEKQNWQKDQIIIEQ